MRAYSLSTSGFLRSHAGACGRCVRTLSPLQGSFVPTLERVDDVCVLSPHLRVLPFPRWSVWTMRAYSLSTSGFLRSHAGACGRCVRTLSTSGFLRSHAGACGRCVRTLPISVENPPDVGISSSEIGNYLVVYCRAPCVFLRRTFPAYWLTPQLAEYFSTSVYMLDGGP